MDHCDDFEPLHPAILRQRIRAAMVPNKQTMRDMAAILKAQLPKIELEIERLVKKYERERTAEN